ncbi:MAG: hypothetical protein AAFX02_07925 [Pseudomonadota bacterium]
MDPFQMVVAIVFIVMVASVLKSRHSNEGGEVAEDYKRELDVMRRRCDELETRVRTLERITTDPERELDRKISGLR